MRVNSMLRPLCDLELGFSRSDFEIAVSHLGGSVDMEWKEWELIGCWTHYVTLNCDLDKFWKKIHIPGIGWPIDMKRKECECMGCWTYYVTLNFTLTHDHDLDLLFSMSNVEIAVSQGWEGQWNGHETKGMWVDRMLDPLYDLELWSWLWIFQGQILK